MAAAERAAGDCDSLIVVVEAGALTTLVVVGAEEAEVADKMVVLEPVTVVVAVTVLVVTVKLPPAVSVVVPVLVTVPGTVAVLVDFEGEADSDEDVTEVTVLEAAEGELPVLLDSTVD